MMTQGNEAPNGADTGACEQGDDYVVVWLNTTDNKHYRSFLHAESVADAIRIAQQTRGQEYRLVSVYTLAEDSTP